MCAFKGSLVFRKKYSKSFGGKNISGFKKSKSFGGKMFALEERSALLNGV